jgi:hypothetical protein
VLLCAFAIMEPPYIVPHPKGAYSLLCTNWLHLKAQNQSSQSSHSPNLLKSSNMCHQHITPPHIHMTLFILSFQTVQLHLLSDSVSLAIADISQGYSSHCIFSGPCVAFSCWVSLAGPDVAPGGMKSTISPSSAMLCLECVSYMECLSE